MENFLSWILLGGFAGWLSGILVGGKDRGCLGDIIVGIIGSVIGGYIFEYFGKSGVTGINLYSIGVAVVGAVVLTIIFKILFPKK